LTKLGIITGTQGVKGKLFVNTTEAINLDLKKVKDIYIGFSEKFSSKFVIIEIEKTYNGYLIVLEGVETKEKAEKLKEYAVFISNDFSNEHISLKDNDDIFGYVVYDDKSLKKIGVVEDVLMMPANDILVVKNKGQEHLIPFIEEFVSSIEKENKKIFIRTVPGLID